MDLLLEKNITMDQFGYESGTKYLEKYMSIKNNANQFWEELEAEQKNSILLQTAEEKKPQKEFEKFLHEYFSN